MTPIDPTNTVPPAPRSSTAPPYVDEDPNIDLVQRGIDVAEDETRDAVADAYEAGARVSGDSPEAMDDIDFTEGEDSSLPAELTAIHEEVLLPVDEEEEE